MREPGNFNRCRSGGPRGLSLTELLVVIAIIGLMMALAVPAVNSMAGGRTVAANLDSLSELLEYARTEAQARSTYVWVGFANLPSTHAANSSGSHQVAAAAFWSADGTPAASGDNLQQLSKLVRLERASFVRGHGGSDLSQEMRSLLGSATTGGATPAALANQGSGKPLPGVSGITFDRSITFTPQGEALLLPQPAPGSPLDAIIDIGVKRMRGDAPEASSPDDGAVWVHGTSGRVRTWRLQ